jgi:hypothetical protein
MTDSEPEGGFSRRAIAWIIGLSLASLSLGLLLTAFGQNLKGRPSPGTNTFSYSAIGHRGLAELLRDRGRGAVSRRDRLEGTPGRLTPLILAEPGVADGTERSRVAALRREAVLRGAPLVLVLPKWDGVADPEHPEWITNLELRPAAEIRRVPAALGLPELGEVRITRGAVVRLCSALFGGRPGTFRVDLRSAQLIDPASGLDPVVVCDDRLLVARVNSRPAVYLVADPDILNNQGLARADHAALVDGLLTVGLQARGVVFDETVHGLSRRAGFLAEALRFPLVLAVAQAVLLGALVVWAGQGRFGKPLPARRGLGDGPEVLIDNTAQLLGQGGHAGECLTRYYRQTLRSVAAAYFLPPDLPEKDVVARLQRAAHGRGLRMDLAGLGQQVERAAASGPAAADRAVRLARILYRWSLEMTSGRTRETAHGHRQHP